MRVSIYIGDISPDEGGGYTFQEDIFRTWLRIRNESHHRFVILTDNADGNIQSPNDQSLQILPAHYKPPSKNLLYNLRSRIPILRRGIKPVNTFQAAIELAQVDYLWPLSQIGFSPVDVPYLFTVWDLQHRLQPWFPEVSSDGEWEWRERYFCHTLQRASGVIVGTQIGKAEVADFYRVPLERIHVLPHPTPSFALEADRVDSETALKTYNLEPGYLFYPAQFWSHKNHVTLLLALSQLRERHALRIPLVLVGSDKGLLPTIRKLITQLALEDQVTILGFVPRSVLISLYLHASALIYPTFFGPENLPPLEAMALDCPVIASDVAGAREQLQDAALLFSPSDEDQLAQEIYRLSTSPELRAELTERGRKRARRWTTTDFVRGVFATLDEFEKYRRSWKP